jgi:hypothetical protein
LGEFRNTEVPMAWHDTVYRKDVMVHVHNFH